MVSWDILVDGRSVVGVELVGGAVTKEEDGPAPAPKPEPEPKIRREEEAIDVFGGGVCG